MTDETIVRGYKAAENIYHRYLTGLILRAVMTRGAADAAELVFRLFRRQQQEKFLPGVEKLGLSDLPDPVKCAQYHYLSNWLGDVNVEYMYESDKKAWVRYPPPRWIWDGTAVCAIPTEVSRAMMRAWHSNNWALLNNPRLGYVCTKQTVDGQPGLEGYFHEADRDLEPEEKMQYAPGEEAPDFDPAAAPSLDRAEWPEERERKALRNYAMEYVRNVIPEMIGLFGPEEAANLGHTTGKLIGMQYYEETAALLDIDDRSAAGFGAFMVRMGRAQGDEVASADEDGAIAITQGTWRLMRGLDNLHPAAFDAWNGLWEGALAAHNRRLRMEVRQSRTGGGWAFEWVIRS